VEYSFPLGLPELRGVALFDFGDAEPTIGGLTAARIRTAAGGGLRIRLRFLKQWLPVDLYFVEALHRERQDDARFFGFSLGFAFGPGSGGL